MHNLFQRLRPNRNLTRTKATLRQRCGGGDLGQGHSKQIQPFHGNTWVNSHFIPQGLTGCLTHVNTLSTAPNIFWLHVHGEYAQNKKTKKRERCGYSLDIFWWDAGINCINDTFSFGHKEQYTPVLQQTIRLTGCGICTACSDLQPSQRGKNKKKILDNMKYTKEKSQCSIYQAYEVLHEYI